MGRKTKKSLEVVASVVEGESEESVMPEAEIQSIAADDDALIPYHTKQAAFALLYLLFFSFLMFTLPFAAFYGVKHLLLDHFHIGGFQNTAWSVLAAVITVNLVIALYAIKGFMDAKNEEDTVKLLAQNQRTESNTNSKKQSKIE